MKPPPLGGVFLGIFVSASFLLSPILLYAEADSHASSSEEEFLEEESIDSFSSSMRVSSFIGTALEAAPNLINTHSTELAAASQQSWGISDSVQTGLDLTSDFTLEAWVKADSFSFEENNIINKYFGADGRRGYRLFTNESGNIRLIICNIFEQCDNITTAYALPTDEWHHIAVTWDPPSRAIRFYIDGVLEESFEGTITSIRDNLRPFRIGTNDGASNQWWNGNIDDVRVWSVVRSPEEIAENYNRELHGSEFKLRGYWKFNDDAGIDQTANGNHLTPRNSPSFSTDVPDFEISEPIDPLILQYEPILYFHEDEDFYPMNVEAFVEASALWDDRGLLEDEQRIGDGEVTVDDIAMPDSDDWYLAFSTPEEAKSFNPSIAKQKYDELVSSGAAVPTYYAHKMEQGDWIVLQYWYFYAFNNWLEHEGRNNHEGDWESVFVFLDKDTEEPEHVAFSSQLNDGEHNNITQYDSVRRSWRELNLETDVYQPKSFAALGSHANYTHPDTYQVFGYQDIASDLGIVIDDWGRKTVISETAPEWMEYSGGWGTDISDITGGSSGPQGPKYLAPIFGGGIVRFEDPVGWAGLNKISTEKGDGAASFFSFENQTTQMSFSEPVPGGESVTSDQHDELITFGNLDEVNLLPRFWDFETTMGEGSFDVEVEFGYSDEEISALGFDEERLSVFFYNETEDIWDKVSSVVDTIGNTVTFNTTHFSRYAIGQEVVTNEPPVLDLIGDKTVGEGDILTFIVTATDPDKVDVLTYSANNLPPGAGFDPLTQTFYWNTDFDDAGNYTDIEFTVTDDGEPLGLDVELITITVGDVNRAPVFENPGPQEILEGERLAFTISAADPDDDAVTLSALNLPEHASFSTSSGEFVWRPSRSQEGVHVITFVATDDGMPQATSTLDVVITVGDNPTPVERANTLIELVLGYKLPQEIENSYLANLKKVPTFIEEGKITPATEQLQAFMKKLEMDYKKGKIDSETKDFLFEYANDILAQLVVY